MVEYEAEREEYVTALREWVEAEQANRDMLDKYFPVRVVTPGTSTQTGEPLDFDEIKRVEDRHKAALDRLRKATDAQSRARSRGGT